MKWLVIIVILVALAAIVWLRTVRMGPGTVRSRQPHRLDDAVIPPASPGLRLDVPPPTTAAEVAAEEGSKAAEESGSDLYSEPEIIGPDEPEPPDDLPPSETRPNA